MALNSLPQLCISFFFISCVQSINYPTGESRGREFVLGFIQNRMLVLHPRIRLYVTSDTDANRPNYGTVTFSVPLMNKDYPPEVMSFSATRSTVIKEYGPALQMRDNDFQYSAIKIESTVDVTVQAANINNLTTDVYVAQPVWAMGMDYYTMSYLYKESVDDQSNHNHGPSEFCVIALEPDTFVEFTWPEHIVEDGGTFRKIPNVMLNTNPTNKVQAYEAFQIQSMSSDLSGVHVHSHDQKPVIVISGTEWTAVEAPIMGDHLAEQLLPTYTWGSEFLLVPLATRRMGDVGKVVASEDDTRVKITTVYGHHVKGVKLDKGENVMFTIPSNMPVHVVANKGVMLAQLSKSYLADNNRQSDPFMMTIPPLQLFTSLYVFSVIQTLKTSDKPTDNDISFDNFLALIVPHGEDSWIEIFRRQKYLSDTVDNRRMKISDLVIQSWENLATLKAHYSVYILNITSVDINKVVHTKKVPFGAFLYGFKLQEAYGGAIGRRIGPLDHNCTQTRTYQGDLFDNDCDGNYDEEIANNIDDDNDGIIDEDLEYVPPETTTSLFWTTPTGFPTTAEDESRTDVPSSDGHWSNGGEGSDLVGNNGGDSDGVIGDGGGSDGGQVTDGDDILTTNLPGEYVTPSPGHGEGSGGQAGGVGSTDGFTPTTDTESGTPSNTLGYNSTGGYGNGEGNTTDNGAGFNSTNISGNSTKSSNDPTSTSTEANLDEADIVSGRGNVPQGVTNCTGVSCQLLSNDSSLDWSLISTHGNQSAAPSLGIFWLHTFWLLNGDTWINSTLLASLMEASSQTFCILVSPKLWCYKQPRWSFLLRLSGVQDSESWQDMMSILSDTGSWIWYEDSIYVHNSDDLLDTFNLLTKWQSIPEGHRLGILWKDTIWIFGDEEEGVTYFSRMINKDGVTVQWQEGLWAWDGAGWSMDDDNLLELLNNTFSIYWNGLLWRWNGSHWERIRIPGLYYNPSYGGFYFSWNNRTWYINSIDGPVEVPNINLPNYRDTGGSSGPLSSGLPVIGFDNSSSSWVLTPDGEWVLVTQDEIPDSLFDPVLGASWMNKLWVYNAELKHWKDSVPHRYSFLKFDKNKPHPGILRDGTYWQWNGTEWVIRFQRSLKQTRRRNLSENFLLNVWWGAEQAWQLQDSVWTTEETSLSNAINLDSTSMSPVLVLAVDGDFWVYNSTDWGLGTIAGDNMDIWENISLAVFYNNSVWQLGDNSLLAAPDVTPEDGLIGPGQVGIMKEGTLWVIDQNGWSEGVMLSNNTPSLGDNTRIGIIFNGTLWLLHNDLWIRENSTEELIPLDMMGDLPALIVNDSLWVLDGNSPTEHDFQYGPVELGDRELSDVNIVWKGVFWSYDFQNKTWFNYTLIRGNFPDAGVIIAGEVWTFNDSLLYKYDQSRGSYVIKHNLTLHYQGGCHSWVNDYFVHRLDCFLPGEVDVIKNSLFARLNGHDWIFNLNDQWTLIDLTEESRVSAPLSLYMGLQIENTTWIWNISTWIRSSSAPGLFDSLSTPILFRNGLYWQWQGGNWIRYQYIHQYVVSDMPVDVKYSNTSWTWFSTDIEVNQRSYKSKQFVYQATESDIAVNINGTWWVCDKQQCQRKLKDLDEVLDELFDENSPEGVNENSTIWVWNGTAWIEMGSSGPANVEGLGSGDGPIFIYVNGAMYKWNGTSWIEVQEGDNDADIPSAAKSPPVGYTDSLLGTTVSSTETGITNNVTYNNAYTQDWTNALITVNGTTWTWDGTNWVSEDGSVSTDPPAGVNSTVTVNGTSYIWDGTSWLPQTEPADFHASTTAQTFTTQPTSGGTGASTIQSATDVNSGTGTIVDDPAITSALGITTRRSAGTNNITHGDLRVTSDGGTLVTSDKPLIINTQRPTSSRSLEPDSGAAASRGISSDRTWLIVVIVLLLLLLLILLIMLCCWCHKRNKRKATQQKVNPAVATVAVPRPNSRYQNPPASHQGSNSSFYDPGRLVFNSAQWSSSSSSSSFGPSSSFGHRLSASTSRYSSRRSRSPKVSQAPPEPVDLPDLIISLPPGKHIHLRSPMLSPDPGLSRPPTATTTRQMFTTDASKSISSG